MDIYLSNNVYLFEYSQALYLGPRIHHKAPALGSENLNFGPGPNSEAGIMSSLCLNIEGYLWTVT